MAVRRDKVAEFRKVLSAEVIDLKRLRQLCFEGCPEEDGIRATCWKLLLGLLPLQTKDWNNTLEKQRTLYQQLLTEVIVNPHKGEESPGGEMVDHPLNPDPKSNWHKFFKDNDVLLQIDHDTRRLYPDISFFQLATAYPKLKYNAGMETLKKRVDRSSLPSQKVATTRGGIRNYSAELKRPRAHEPYTTLKEGEEAHWEVVERILFIHTKMNRGIGYVQGMNEIIGPIYYVFAQHPDEKQNEHAEADTFFCFTCVMAEIGDRFTKTLDTSRAGIGGAMKKLMRLLKDKDPEVHESLIDKEIDPAFFGFRWLTLLLSQEFLLPDVIRIWDSLFADEKRFDFLLYICCAMLISIRSELLQGDFAACVKLLQHYPLNDIQKLLHLACDLWKSR